MSTQATSWAFAQPGLTSLQKFLLVALANSADKSGVAWVGQASLADDCACSRETVSRNMSALEESGLIARVERRRVNGSRTSDYTILAPGHADRGSMIDAPGEEFPSSVAALAKRGDPASCDPASCDADAPGHVTQTGGPDPLVEPSVPSGERARAGARVKIGGKPVNATAWERTERILASFNQQAGTKLRLLTSAGQPSEAAKRIYGRVVAYPDIAVAEHEDIIRRTLLSKWWGDGPPGVGVVFGPKVFEDNITRQPSGAKVSKAAKDAALAERRERGMAAIARLTAAGEAT